MEPTEAVAPTYARLGPEVDALVRITSSSYRETVDAVAREVARGRIVARLREPSRDGSWVVLVELAAGGAWVVFDHGGTWWSAYAVPSVEAGRAAARAVLASGSAFNW